MLPMFLAFVLGSVVMGGELRVVGGQHLSLISFRHFASDAAFASRVNSKALGFVISDLPLFNTPHHCSLHLIIFCANPFILSMVLQNWDAGQ